MFRALILAGLVAVFNTTAWAQPGAANFDRLDRDRSGTLTPNELPEGVRGNFQRIDADGDGEVTRKELAEFLARRRGNADRIENMTIEKDIPYADTENPRQQLDLYLPRERKSERLPVIVFIHGGGWRNGDKAGGALRLAPFVQSGEYAGVSVGYRLTDEAQWPSQIHDCKAAVRWIRANADKYGFIPDRIGVWGTSAGGHLVSMLGVSGDVTELEGDLGSHTDQSSKVTCVANFYGPTDMVGMTEASSRLDHAAANSPEGKLLGGAIRDRPDAAKSASPVTHVSSGDPPVLTVHGTRDPVVPFDQGKRFDKALRAAGVETYLVPVEGAGHGNFRGETVNERLSDFFEKFLRDQDSVSISTEPIKQ